jgi:hypothetical protein
MQSSVGIMRQRPSPSSSAFLTTLNSGPVTLLEGMMLQLPLQPLLSQIEVLAADEREIAT